MRQLTLRHVVLNTEVQEPVLELADGEEILNIEVYTSAGHPVFNVVTGTVPPPRRAPRVHKA